MYTAYNLNSYGVNNTVRVVYFRQNRSRVVDLVVDSPHLANFDIGKESFYDLSLFLAFHVNAFEM